VREAQALDGGAVGAAADAMRHLLGDEARVLGSRVGPDGGELGVGRERDAEEQIDLLVEDPVLVAAVTQVARARRRIADGRVEQNALRGVALAAVLGERQRTEKRRDGFVGMSAFVLAYDVQLIDEREWRRRLGRDQRRRCRGGVAEELRGHLIEQAIARERARAPSSNRTIRPRQQASAQASNERQAAARGMRGAAVRGRKEQECDRTPHKRSASIKSRESLLPLLLSFSLLFLSRSSAAHHTSTTTTAHQPQTPTTSLAPRPTFPLLSLSTSLPPSTTSIHHVVMQALARRHERGPDPDVARRRRLRLVRQPVTTRLVSLRLASQASAPHPAPRSLVAHHPALRDAVRGHAHQHAYVVVVVAPTTGRCSITLFAAANRTTSANRPASILAEDIDSMIQRLVMKNARRSPRNECAVFSIEDAQTLVRDALTSREEQLIEEYNKILHDRLQGTVTP